MKGKPGEEEMSEEKTKKPHWVGVEYEFAYCSECGKEIYTHFETTLEAIDNWHTLYNFCPNCGAKMDLTHPFCSPKKRREIERKNGR